MTNCTGFDETNTTEIPNHVEQKVTATAGKSANEIPRKWSGSWIRVVVFTLSSVLVATGWLMSAGSDRGDDLVKPQVNITTNEQLDLESSSTQCFVFQSQDGKSLQQPKQKHAKSSIQEWPFARGSAEGTAYVPQSGPTSQPNIIWTFKSRGPRPAGAMGSMSCTPVCKNGVVYWGSDDGLLYALRASTGEKTWSYSIVKNPKPGEGQVLGSPALSEKCVFVGFFGKGIACLDRKNGSEIWTKEFVLTVCSPVAVKDEVLFGHSTGISCYDDSSFGNETFSFTPPKSVIGIKGAVFGVISVVKDTCYFGSDNGSIYALKLPEGKKTWGSAQTNGLARNAVAVADESVFASVGNALLCMNSSTGKQLWRHAFGAKDVLTHPAISPELVIIGSNNGKVYGLTRKDGKLKWTHEKKSDRSQAPIICKNVVYVPVGKTIFALDLETGKQQWELTLPATISAAPAFSDNMLFVPCSNGMLYALGEKKPKK